MTDFDPANPYNNLNPAENDFIQALPEGYRLGALASYKTFMRETAYGNVFEKSKSAHAYMTAFVTATYFVMKQDGLIPETPGA